MPSGVDPLGLDKGLVGVQVGRKAITPPSGNGGSATYGWYGALDHGVPVLHFTVSGSLDSSGCNTVEPANPDECKCDDRCKGKATPKIKFVAQREPNDINGGHPLKEFTRGSGWYLISGNNETQLKGGQNFMGVANLSAEVDAAPIDCCGDIGSFTRTATIAVPKSKRGTGKAFVIITYKLIVRECGEVFWSNISAKLGPGDSESHTITLVGN